MHVRDVSRRECAGVLTAKWGNSGQWAVSMAGCPRKAGGDKKRAEKKKDALAWNVRQ